MRKPTEISVLNFESFVKMSRQLYQFRSQFYLTGSILQAVEDYLKRGEAIGFAEAEEKPDSQSSV